MNMQNSGLPFYSCFLCRYDVFDIEAPSLHYEIKISMLILDEVKLDRNEQPVYSWRQISNFTLRPDQTIGRSADGRVFHFNQCHCAV